MWGGPFLFGRGSRPRELKWPVLGELHPKGWAKIWPQRMYRRGHQTTEPWHYFSVQYLEALNGSSEWKWASVTWPVSLPCGGKFPASEESLKLRSRRLCQQAFSCRSSWGGCLVGFAFAFFPFSSSVSEPFSLCQCTWPCHLTLPFPAFSPVSHRCSPCTTF